MRVREYEEFVRSTDQSVGKPANDRRSIALYGLVGEIGSLVSAIKKKLLGEDASANWEQPNDEIKEELGDALWYVVALAQLQESGPSDVFAGGIAFLRDEIDSKTERALAIKKVLSESVRDSFLDAAKRFPSVPDYCFDEYQAVAFKTARTQGRVLLEVCITLLWQLGAELLHATLPEVEKELDEQAANRSTSAILSDIVWHLSAIASLYQLSLDDIVSFNCKKVGYRSKKGLPTPLHDADRLPKEQFPRCFEVTFVPVGPGKSRMYFEGRPLGHDLTDNAYEDDGYRFHDVFHLALIAHLGWSPVIRGLMKRKRKSGDDKADEVEDGGRAKVVEELVLKAVHSEAVRLAKASGRCSASGPDRLFPNRGLITFRLLKLLQLYVENLEVAKNQYWEWENAIFEGSEIYAALRQYEQGTVLVDLEKRKLTFSPLAAPQVRGVTIGSGMATSEEACCAKPPFAPEFKDEASQKHAEKMAVGKLAILESLGLPKSDAKLLSEVELSIDGNNRMSVRVAGDVQARMWSLRVVDFKPAFATSAGQILCTVMAIADAGDVTR